jgi:photoactive yellow protein
MDVVKYENYDLNTIIERIPEKIRDDLPFGLVKLDLNGTIIEYNMAEAELTGFRPEEVIGRNFFLDVATCTQTPEFYGKFREGVDAGLVNVQFDYMFDHQMVATVVRVRMVQMNNHVWMTVRRLSDTGQVVDVARAPGYKPQSQPADYLPPAQPAQAQPNLAVGAPWVSPRSPAVDPAYAQQAAFTLRGTPMPQPPLPPQAQQAPQQPAYLQPRPAPAQPKPRTGADGLESFDFNS